MTTKAQKAYDAGYNDGRRAMRLQASEEAIDKIQRIAHAAIQRGIEGGAVLWRDALQDIELRAAKSQQMRR